jgi:hypothetical protein
LCNGQTKDNPREGLAQGQSLTTTSSPSYRLETRSEPNPLQPCQVGPANRLEQGQGAGSTHSRLIAQPGVIDSQSPC